jgi:hypothetical protein
MRRALLLGVVGVALTAGLGLVLALPAAPAPSAGPRITRLFIPAIKDTCRSEAELPPEADLGYTFTKAGALVTLDQNGSLTGIPSYQLYVLNLCLARYPIAPPADPPKDRYSRNLLYDYYGGSLKPCLESRVGDLPPLPSRADFLVRLYPWDPYRVIAPGRPLGELLSLERQCPALPPYLVPD